MSNLSGFDFKRFFGFIILLALAGSAFYTFFNKQKEDKVITYSTSDAKNLKGEISIALDSWIGYFPFKSPVFGKLMRDAGYRIKILDDKADYSSRMKMLKKGKIDFAVATIDSYLLNGKSEKYPGTIVAIVDESKGGDAILSWKNKFTSIDKLKNSKNFKIAYTPASPSEHLIKSISVHFGITSLAHDKKFWRVEVDGAEEAYEKLINKEVDLAALWEPHVTEALSNKGIKKLIGSEDIDKLIVDILLVSRKYARKNPHLAKLFIQKYFETLSIYQSSLGKLKKDIVSSTDISEKHVKYMLKGVRWLSYAKNINWFGLTNKSNLTHPEIVDTINSTIKILLGNKDFTINPLTDNDPYTILNSSFLRNLYNSGNLKYGSSVTVLNSIQKRFAAITEKQWGMLKVIGSLKLRPISFRSGTANIDAKGKEQIIKIVNSIKHYPNFRILIKGHTGMRGDQAANKTLSFNRASAVKKQFQYRFNIDPNRVKVFGVGGKEPLLKSENESLRSYNNRLKRVEILFVK